MRNPRQYARSLPLLAGVAIVTTMLVQIFSSTESELFSETICWILLPVLRNMARINKVKSKSRDTVSLGACRACAHTSSLRLWIIAAGVAAVGLYKAVFGSVTLFPALTPLLLLAQKQCGPQPGALNRPGLPALSSIGSTVRGTGLVAFFSICVLLGCDFRGASPCIIAIVALLAVYVLLLREVSSASSLPPLNVSTVDVQALSARVVVTLIGSIILQAAFFGAPECQVAPTVAAGVFKSLSWYFIIETAKHSVWHVAAAIGTFSMIATFDSARLSSETLAIAHVVAACLSLAQVIAMISEHFDASMLLWIMSIFPATTYLMNRVAIMGERGPSSSALTSIYLQQHPVEALIQRAHAEFTNLTDRQSSTLEMAYAQYRERYAMEPPPGFDLWYSFATSKKSELIDDFDAIYEAISPFLSISGQKLNSIISEVYNDPESELWLCHFSGKLRTTHCRHAYRSYDRHISTLFDALLHDIPFGLPDLRFFVNHLDEPRVLLPMLPRSTLESSDSPSPAWESWSLTDFSQKPTWKNVTKLCTSQSVIESHREDDQLETFGLPFVKSRSQNDLCQHPEYRNMHGLFLSPTSMKLFNGMVPVLSTGTPSTMGDILYPSPAYIEPEFLYSPEDEVPWDQKGNQVYWTGSNTGGVATDGKWRWFHRQRFVELVQGRRQAYYYLRHSPEGNIRLVKSAFLNGRTYVAGFARIFQCKKPFCHRQRAYFGTRPWDPKDQALKSRLVFDIDGNGISGRFYKLLASMSLPLKQTILREWHDERLVPWMHYVPVSQSMDELPELVRYMTSTESGRRRAKDIAFQGREWFSRAFREDDMGIYVYRLLLELARLQDPRREAI